MKCLALVVPEATMVDRGLCVECGAQTQLYRNGLAICTACDDVLEKQLNRWPWAVFPARERSAVASVKRKQKRDTL